ncbi:MAG: FAD-binding protein [Hamadaea sp.]|uniref:FAD-binding protein n=1 Tax=Hamadaea sp. TaxID=2024425 RepID=UPI00183EA9A3|nr:FAD-binding protein [Hamadaea sp.]NUT24099.1 FAD-binding protein [Hamadaea sp.]
MTGLDPGATAAAAAPGSRPSEVARFAEVDQLGDALRTGVAEVTAVAGDFGNRVRRVPVAVLRPRTPDDIVAAVRFGARLGIPVVPRGAGHAVDGQAQTGRGIVVDLTTLAGVGRPDADRISVGAGARWGAVLDATLPAGLMPPVLPDFLELTVGGTISAGGVGGASHHHGSVSDNVIDLDVITPDGDLVLCSADRERARFDGVRGTQGEHGVIARVTLRLTAAPAGARRYLLRYADLATFVADQLRLAVEGRFAHVLGQIVYDPAGRLSFFLEAAATFTAESAADEPDDEALLRDLNHQGIEAIQTLALRDFLGRLAPLTAQLRATGSWQTDPHPRCNVMLPGESVERIASGVLDGLTPRLLGPGGSILFIPIPTARIVAPNVPKATSDELTVLFGLQRTAPAGDRELVRLMRAANSALYSEAETAGGTGYTALSAYHMKRAESEPGRQ